MNVTYSYPPFMDNILYIVLVLGLIVSLFVNRKMSKESDRPQGIMGWLYVALVVVSVITLFAGSVAIFTSQVYLIVASPKYQSTVVGVKSEWVQQAHEDSDGDTYYETVQMHTAVLEFYDGDGNLHRLRNDISSRNKPSLGKKVTVTYNDGEMREFSWRSFLVLIGLATFMILLGLGSAFIVFFAFNISNERLKVFGAAFLIYYLIPASMCFMAGAMLYAILSHHVYGGNMSGLEQVVLFFFSIVIMICIYSYFKYFLLDDEESMEDSL